MRRAPVPTPVSLTILLSLLHLTSSIQSAHSIIPRDRVKRYSAFRSDLGKRYDNAEDLSQTQYNSVEPLSSLVDYRQNSGAESSALLNAERTNSLGLQSEDNADLEKRYSQFRSDFGKRLYRSDFGKRLYRSDFGKRLNGIESDFDDDNDANLEKRYSQFRSDFGKRLYRSDFGKRPYRSDFGKRLYRSDFGKRMYRSDFGKRLYRSDFGKRLFRTDLGKKSAEAEEESLLYAGSGGDQTKRRSMFRSDLGKRSAAPSSWWYNRRVFRSDLGKRSQFRSDLG